MRNAAGRAGHRAHVRPENVRPNLGVQAGDSVIVTPLIPNHPSVPDPSRPGNPAQIVAELRCSTRFRGIGAPGDQAGIHRTPTGSIRAPKVIRSGSKLIVYRSAIVLLIGPISASSSATSVPARSR